MGSKLALMKLFESLIEQLKNSKTFFLENSKFSLEKFRGKMLGALHLPTICGIGQYIYAVSSVLDAAVKLHSRKADNAFVDFAIQACTKGASVGHKLVKVFEKDATLSYESEHNVMLKDMGGQHRHAHEHPGCQMGYRKVAHHRGPLCAGYSDCFRPA